MYNKGFQSESVDSDLAHTGLLCLRCLLHFTGSDSPHRVASLRMLAAQSTAASRSSASYPFAVVARNLTLMLSDVLQLRGGAYSTSRAPFWGVFDQAGERAFAELFCWAFKRLDTIWQDTGASRDEFGAIIGQVKGELENVLSTGPDSVGAFLERAT
jgi:ELMO/CED-12 family